MKFTLHRDGVDESIEILAPAPACRFRLGDSVERHADVEIPEGGAEGMILTSGGRFGGYGFYLLKSKPVFLWNLVGLKRLRWEGPDALEPGKQFTFFSGV